MLARPFVAFLATTSCLLCAASADAQALTYSLAGGNEGWPGWAKDGVTASMDEAVAIYNDLGHFDKHLTANYNAGVPTAEANYDGWISFGGSYNTRVALHEIAHTLGIGTYWGFDGGSWAEDSAAGRLVKLFDGQGAVLNTGGTHFWPYGLNFDSEDGAEARERHVKLVAAFRYDMGIVVDSDADGLPDDWETFHFAGLTQDGLGDPDADGIDNAAEYASDGDPGLAVPVRDGRTYVIRGQITELALTVIDASQNEAAATEQRPYMDSASQHWTAAYLGDGFFSFANASSGKVLEVPSTDTASALPVQQADWTGAFKQQWRLAKAPGADEGYFQISNRETGRVVDGLDGADGAPVQQYPLLGNLPQQFWRFDDVEGDGGADGGVGDAGPMNDAGPSNDAGADGGVVDGSAGGSGGAPGAADAGRDGAADHGGLGALPWLPAEGGASDAAAGGGCSALSVGTHGGALAYLLALAGLLAWRRRSVGRRPDASGAAAENRAR